MSEENFDNLDVYYQLPENKLKEECYNCHGKEFDRIGPSSFGRCKKCNLDCYNVVYPIEKCIVCGCRTYWSRTKDERFICSEHWNRISFNLMCDSSKTRFRTEGRDSDWDIEKIYENENGKGRRVLLTERFMKFDFNI